MSKDETPSTIRSLYRLIFRGFGWVFLAGMLTWLYLLLRTTPHK